MEFNEYLDIFRQLGQNFQVSFPIFFLGIAFLFLTSSRDRVSKETLKKLKKTCLLGEQKT